MCSPFKHIYVQVNLYLKFKRLVSHVSKDKDFFHIFLFYSQYFKRSKIYDLKNQTVYFNI